LLEDYRPYFLISIAMVSIRGEKTQVLRNATRFLFDREGGGSRAIRAIPIYMGRFSIRGFPYSDLFSEGDDVD